MSRIEGGGGVKIRLHMLQISLRSSCTAGSLTNKQRLQLKCHFPQKSRDKNFTAGMSEGKEEEKLLLSRILGQRVKCYQWSV